MAQIARAIARMLGLDEDLAEALALAHDLGHTPFGHAGEDGAGRSLEPFGGFDHNAQALRLVTRLERRYAEFDGLNLTWETLEGLVKHNGPLLKDERTLQDLPAAIVEYCQDHDLELEGHAGAEAQVAALADDIAYNNHDIDDGLRAGFFALDDLATCRWSAASSPRSSGAIRAGEPRRLIHETIRRLIDRMVATCSAETRRRLAEARASSASSDVRARGRPLVAFSDAMATARPDLRRFLHERMYRHYKVNRMTRKARRVVAELFELLLAPPTACRTLARARRRAGSAATADAVADYIAGMTDRYALDEHDRLFKLTGFRP